MIKGRKLSIWVPKEDLWIFDALQQLRDIAERQGIPLSQGAAAVEVLKIGLERHRAQGQEPNSGDHLSSD